jgi:predicted permease
MRSSSAAVRLLIRRLARSPGFTALTLLTLAIGIGANTAIFSVVHGILLKPLSYPQPERLVSVWQTAKGLNLGEINASPVTYFTYREEGRAFQDIGLWSGGTASVTGLAEPEQVQALYVTDGVLPLLGVPAARGRFFLRQEDSPRAPRTVILSYAYWQQKFGGAPNTIGRTLLVDGRQREIVGIMPERFRFLDRPFSLVMPLQFDRNETFIGNFSYFAIARLKPGVGITQANTDVARMLPLLAHKFPPPPGMSLKMFEEVKLGPDVRPLIQDVTGGVSRVLWVLMSAIGLVLFIACANVANLLLVRAEGRQQELAIRAALGASWQRLARGLLLETMALALAGGALGVAVAYGALRLLLYLAPANLPRLSDIAIDPSVLLFALAVSLVSGLLFGVVPVFKYATPGIANALRGGGRTFSDGRERHRAQRTLVVVQVALALVVLTGSGLMIRTFQAMRRVQPGFTQPDQVLTLRISIPAAQVPEPERAARMHHDILQRIAAVSGVSSVALTNSVTMDGGNNNDPIFVQDKPAAEDRIPPLRRFKHISPGVFRTVGNTVLAGRDFDWTDVFEMRPVAILSDNLAREYWGSPAAAIGKRIRENPKGEWREVVGVAANEYDDGVHRKPPGVAYWPILKANFWNNKLDVRRSLVYAIRSGRTGSESFLQEVRQAVWSVNPGLPIAGVRSLEEIYRRSMARTSFTLVMLGIAAGMALLLGVVGIYGVISYSISRRTREIGIRMALGAPQARVRTMFVRQGLVLAAIGVCCGVAAAIPLARLMSALLYDVSPLDPLTYVVVAAVIAAAALLAAWVPARSATRVAPLDALRAD